MYFPPPIQHILPTCLQDSLYITSEECTGVDYLHIGLSCYTVRSRRAGPPIIQVSTSSLRSVPDLQYMLNKYLLSADSSRQNEEWLSLPSGLLLTHRCIDATEKKKFLLWEGWSLTIRKLEFSRCYRT